MHWLGLCGALHSTGVRVEKDQWSMKRTNGGDVTHRNGAMNQERDDLDRRRCSDDLIGILQCWCVHPSLTGVQ